MQTRLLPASLAFVILLFISACNNDDPAPVGNAENTVTIEGVEYETITIGMQTWTSSNYAGPGGIAFDDTNSKPEYGKYYSRIEAEAIRVPAGWRLPTKQDYEKLAAFYGITFPTNGTHTESIKALTSKSNWNHVLGTNTSGFNAHPGGYIFQNSKPIPGDIAEFWTSEGITLSIQEAGTGLTNLRIAFYQSDNSPDYKFNVRFIKD
ncbi:FISUMP domain-containing protein [Chryseolinea sp. T2]|uniref:FISUMP domain-containing protein n=1 Tax=Chryseolinea sp. T2 TaxID=3129255 RepID=UPI0030772B75